VTSPPCLALGARTRRPGESQIPLLLVAHASFAGKLGDINGPDTAFGLILFPRSRSRSLSFLSCEGDIVRSAPPRQARERRKWASHFCPPRLPLPQDPTPHGPAPCLHFLHLFPQPHTHVTGRRESISLPSDLGTQSR